MKFYINDIVVSYFVIALSKCILFNYFLERNLLIKLTINQNIILFIIY